MKTTFIYTVILWDDSGNIMKESFTVKVTRVREASAKNYVKTKYPCPYFVELDTINYPKKLKL